MNVIERQSELELRPCLEEKGRELGEKILRTLQEGPPLEKPRIIPFNTEQEELAKIHDSFCNVLQIPVDGEEVAIMGVWNRLTRSQQMCVEVRGGQLVGEAVFGWTYVVEPIDSTVSPNSAVAA